ncbi:hypothetical protein NKI62_30995, partial [Mesorhizobium sp. M0488]
MKRINAEVSAAPHCPAGHFSPYRDGEKEAAAISAPFLQRWRLAKPAMRASLSPSLYLSDSHILQSEVGAVFDGVEFGEADAHDL